MKNGCEDLGYDEIHDFWEPTHKDLKVFFGKLDNELLENDENVVIFVYYTGHGLMDERSLIVLNDAS